ncbi:MAG TPA: NADH-quinone oxidoreductase subunit NuoK [Planctomycetota bacterium]|nr:NADH-quinone oxidoreductase subunit NuoK [Planctomycetota bacterium]
MTKYLLLSALLFSIGAFGVLSRRNLLIILMSVELMLNGVNVALVAFSRVQQNLHGHVFVMMVMGVAAAEVGVGLALLIALFRNRRIVDAGDLTTMKDAP